MEPSAKKKRGRPAEDKATRGYTLDSKLAEFLDALPDGERSRFVNRLLAQEVEVEKLSGKFYTYLLMRPDGSVFYIGKGTGDRINQHEGQARRGVDTYKCRVIRKVWEEGDQIIKQKVAFFDDEQDAYQLEILLISFFGRENLTNCTDGGEGASIGNEYGRPAKPNRVRVNIKLDTDLYERTKNIDRSQLIIDLLNAHFGISE